MKIHGLQKMTLLDYPGHVACTVFLGGCDFLCPFCHNYGLADGSEKPVMEDGELLDFLKKRTSLLDGVALTGGEPLLNPKTPELLKNIRELGYKIKLDTNGYHPEALERVIREGLIDYIAMDIKNSPEKYPVTCGVSGIDMERIKKSISLLINSAPDYEFRTTVVSELHNACDFERIGEQISGAKKYFIQSFTDRDSVHFSNLHAPDKKELENYRKIMEKYVENAYIRGVD